MIIFPLNTGQRYYSLHYQYILNIFQYLKLPITFQSFPEIHKTKFICIINNKKVLFDFSDGDDVFSNIDVTKCFKFHYTKKHNVYNNMLPISPISFHDWNLYTDSIKYTATGKILNNQKAYGNATQRRNFVKNLLLQKYGNEVDTQITNQQVFLNKINNCLCYVHVPGFCDEMIDRASLQFLGLGCLVITPYIPEIFPFDMMFENKIHYIQCETDYSDLIQKIEWVKLNKEEAIQIGNNAKELFKECCTPEKIWEWILVNI